MPSETLLAETLVELADNLVEDFDVIDLLTLLAARCIEVLDVTAAGLMLADVDGNLHVVASSSDAIEIVELFEIQAREGPCLDAYRTGEPVFTENLSDVESRWPRLAAVAIENGFRSVHALPMRLRGTTIGAINLFRADTGVLDAADVSAAKALAAVSTIAILQHRAFTEARELTEQLTGALNSRIVIEQAKGVVGESSGVDMQEAFVRLRCHARTNNLRLSDVAKAIVDRTLATSALAPGRPDA